MSNNIFGGLTGIKFPDTVMNQGPLPSVSGSLPAPLHSTPDGKYNYNSTLLGDLQPYAYADSAYISSQSGYLNIPHRLQKVIPVVHLPEPTGHDTFRLSHGVDDGDLAFCLRINQMSLFSTGRRNVSRRNGLGTAIDTFVNLPTLNYLLAGIQINTNIDKDEPGQHGGSNFNLWFDFLYALDARRFPEFSNRRKRDYTEDKVDLDDLLFIVENCIRPFGVMRGSEKQGGQDETGSSPATWPVPFVGTFVVDGKEEHIVNMWHDHNVDSGKDLVLRLKPMPMPSRYYLNHYYKDSTYKDFDKSSMKVVWQLVPDVFENASDSGMYEHLIDSQGVWEKNNMPPQFLMRKVSLLGSIQKVMLMKTNMIADPKERQEEMIKFTTYRQYIPVFYNTWQELGFWHVGRTQMRITRYNVSGGNYYYNDCVNGLRSQYMVMTVQPMWEQLPYFLGFLEIEGDLVVNKDSDDDVDLQTKCNDSRRASVAGKFIYNIVGEESADTPGRAPVFNPRSLERFEQPVMKWRALTKPAAGDASVPMEITESVQESLPQPSLGSEVASAVKKTQNRRRRDMPSVTISADGSVNEGMAQSV